MQHPQEKTLACPTCLVHCCSWLLCFQHNPCDAGQEIESGSGMLDTDDGSHAHMSDIVPVHGSKLV